MFYLLYLIVIVHIIQMFVFQYISIQQAWLTKADEWVFFVSRSGGFLLLFFRNPFIAFFLLFGDEKAKSTMGQIRRYSGNQMVHIK